MSESVTLHTVPTLQTAPENPWASAGMRTLDAIAEEIARTNIPVLITGDSGTGKQFLARRIHEMSMQCGQLLVQIDCATATPETLVSDLRLRERKSTPAGTVIFDEIGEFDRESQRALLHLLPDGDLAATRQLLKSRMISTSSQNLEDEIRAGRFRSELFYRVNGVCLRIPPLNERREDIPQLVNVFLDKHAMRFGKAKPDLSAHGVKRLQEHAWPGNVRELENVVMKIVALGEEEIALADLATPCAKPLPTQAGDGSSLKAVARAASREAERELILKALAKTRWNRKRAAQELQISYKSLLYKLKQIGFEEPNQNA